MRIHTRAALSVLAPTILAACLNTKSVAFEQQPPELSSPAVACRSAAEAEGYEVVEVTDVREVSPGYWEARFVVNDDELRNALGCRHNPRQGFTEVVRLDG